MENKTNWEEMYKKEYKLRQEAEKEICELRQDNRRLAHEVEDKINRIRKSVDAGTTSSVRTCRNQREWWYWCY